MSPSHSPPRTAHKAVFFRLYFSGGFIDTPHRDGFCVQAGRESKGSLGGGARQDTCRPCHAANGCLS